LLFYAQSKSREVGSIWGIRSYNPWFSLSSFCFASSFYLVEKPNNRKFAGRQLKYSSGTIRKLTLWPKSWPGGAFWKKIFAILGAHGPVIEIIFCDYLETTLEEKFWSGVSKRPQLGNVQRGRQFVCRS